MPPLGGQALTFTVRAGGVIGGQVISISIILLKISEFPDP